MVSLIKKLTGKFSKNKDWKQIEYFDEKWKDRIKAMSIHIKVNEKVMDLGCGQMWLKEFLPKGCSYTPVDYKKRGVDTVICDFNLKEFPNDNVDVIFVSGCLEYIKDYDWFIEKICTHAKRCIISYCTIETHSDLGLRNSLTWVNNLSTNDIINIFKKNKYNLTNKFIVNTNTIFIFNLSL